ncbi:DNA-binding protein [Longimycelium tulufanense]|uniref:DNA-binding protein n=1 Tax=Longimycelium tulufanense TaxID=907463 RepID=A0A8J3CFK0_9PSEU|nr:ComEA family DNA-binding protein [Longimycelium tulufanense]GGM53360.1 DNA-binding protein [Longimycelium tulufanense]
MFNSLTFRNDIDLTRSRLAALTGCPAPGRHRIRTETDDGGPDPPTPQGKEDQGPTRWVPDALRQARIDPGHRVAIVLCVLALLVVVGFAAHMVFGRPTPELVPPLPAAQTTVPSSAVRPVAQQDERMVVSVVGRVHRPGLLTLREGARVAEALDAAGGLLPDTDTTGLNLARKLADGEQVHVGIPVPGGMAADGGVLAADGPTGETTGKINLNTASVQQLDELPGVGPVTAQRIVDRRTRNGPFRNVEQLREVEGIGETRLARLRELVTV